MAVIARIYPDGLDLDNANWTAPAGTKQAAIDDLWGNHDGDSTYVECSTNSARIRFTMGAMAAATLINFIELVVISRGIDPSGAQVWFGVRNGTTDVFLGAESVNQSYREFRGRVEEDPNTGAPWTTSGVNSVVSWLEMSTPGTNVCRVTSAYIEVDGALAPAHLGAARDVSSRQLWLRRSLLSTIRGRLPFSAVDRELLGLAQWTHYAGPRPTDEGWGMAPWEREIGMGLSVETDLDSPDLGTMVEDLNCRRFFVMDWDTGISESAPGRNSPGIPRLNAGAGRAFTRASVAHVESAAAAAQGLTQIVEIADDIEKNTTLGQLIESAATNLQIQSSFVNGLTGWTSAGTGSNGSAIAVDASVLLFHPDVSPNSVRITSGNPIHVADLTLTGTATTAIADAAKVVVYFWHREDAVPWPLYYQVIRDVGGTPNYWRDSDSTWQAAATWNAMTSSSLAWHRHVVKLIDVGTNTPDCTLQARVGVPTALGAAGQVNWIGHTQIVVGRQPSSAIVTGAATATRALDDLRLENFTGARVYPEQQGTTFFQYRPEGNSSEMTGTTVLLLPTNSVGNFERLRYEIATGQFQFERRVSSVSYVATFTTALVRGTLYKIGLRRTGTQAEHGVAANTLDIWVNGVKGTGVVAVANPAWSATSVLRIGQDASSANQVEGYLTHRFSTPVVYTDEEMVAETT